MPSASKFSAMSTTKMRQTFDIGLLNGATGDRDGNVILHNGQHVHGVNLIPALVHYDFDSTQHAIVWHALKFLGKLDECWRSVDDRLLPGIKRLDYSKIGNIKVRRRKQLLYDVSEHVDGASVSMIDKDAFSCRNAWLAISVTGCLPHLRRSGTFRTLFAICPALFYLRSLLLPILPATDGCSGAHFKRDVNDHYS
jgi:hypothetical protein